MGHMASGSLALYKVHGSMTFFYAMQKLNLYFEIWDYFVLGH